MFECRVTMSMVSIGTNGVELTKEILYLFDKATLLVNQ